MNTNILKYFTALLFVLLLPQTGAAAKKHNPPPHTPPLPTLHFVEQNLDVKVEIAKSQEEREKGLMNRTSLPEKQGMLFVFGKLSRVSVWMKNTLLPLDVLFLDADGRIVSFYEDLQPCKQDPCPVYSFGKPGFYMLELNAHFMKKHQVSMGQQILIPKLD